MNHSSLPGSEEMFRRLADHFPGLAWMVSLAQGRPRLVYASPASQPVWEWCRQNLQDDFQKLGEIIHPEDFSEVKKAWARLLQGEQVSGEVRLLGPAGEVHGISVQAFPVDPENSPPRLMVGFCLETAAGQPFQKDEATLAWEARVNAALAEVSQAVIKSTPPPELSCLVLDKAKELTSSDWSSVAYLDHHTRELVFPDLEGEASENSFGPAWNHERWAWSARWARCLAER